MKLYQYIAAAAAANLPDVVIETVSGVNKSTIWEEVADTSIIEDHRGRGGHGAVTVEGRQLAFPGQQTFGHDCSQVSLSSPSPLSKGPPLSSNPLVSRELAFNIVVSRKLWELGHTASYHLDSFCLSICSLDTKLLGVGSFGEVQAYLLDGIYECVCVYINEYPLDINGYLKPDRVKFDLCPLKFGSNKKCKSGFGYENYNARYMATHSYPYKHPNQIRRGRMWLLVYIHVSSRITDDDQWPAMLSRREVWFVGHPYVFHVAPSSSLHILDMILLEC
ncbi:LOW QUALITY PROTEIN: hypothetical protein NC651_027730 [Populus alba x Populus x berolinensis]|nr:LOW QUALITY PROTEIN: hypothetical protein NC651_027730 [Populus alba x Populus x berolinensis]